MPRRLRGENVGRPASTRWCSQRGNFPPGVEQTPHTTTTTTTNKHIENNSSDEEWQVVPPRKTNELSSRTHLKQKKGQSSAKKSPGARPKPKLAEPREVKPASPKVENPAITACVHFAKGSCRNGAKCRFLHVPEPAGPQLIEISLPPAAVALPKPIELKLPKPEPAAKKPAETEPIEEEPEQPAKSASNQVAMTDEATKPTVIAPTAADCSNLEPADKPTPEPAEPPKPEPKPAAIPGAAPESTPAPLPAQSWAHHTSTFEPEVISDPLLRHKWVFWEHRGLPKGGGSESAYHHAIGYVGECSSVGGFWSVFNNIPAPSEFFCAPPKRTRAQLGGRLVEGWSLFRHGVQPEWEDPKNCAGAELTVSTDSLEQCDRCWQNILLATIGSCLPCSDEITGVRVIDKCKKGTKPVYRLEVWFTAEADVKALKPALIEALEHPNPSLKLKQHSTQKPLLNASKQPAAQVVDTTGRVKDVRALLAKLTPERFDRLSQQLQCLLGDGSQDTVAAVVQCIKLCTLQTPIFHGMYANLVAALKGVQGVTDGVIHDCMTQLAVRTEDNRHNAKHAASFAAELCARGIISEEQISQELASFQVDPVHIELLCTLLTKLQPIKALRGRVQTSVGWLREVAETAALAPRLKFMIQDVLRL
eukprot:TRINITY_DN132_c0_g1_i1.p1 TRINITY_DN132_c0_g1~~TRINITY_DN132_c0_g1_i1.p1  ORF type:complete len:648 (-),score=151.11 TRINITY_DN132_c0_g1_i1:229-2172(-)